VSGLVDLHCHLLWGLDDGAKTLEDSLEMARILVRLGFATVAPSPHNRLEYAPKAQAEARLEEVRAALEAAGIPLQLERNSENYFLDEGLYTVAATDLHSPIGAEDWLGRSLKELKSRAGEESFALLTRDNPARILAGQALES